MKSKANDAMNKTFNTTVERDAWLDRVFPKRTCSETPGCYNVPEGVVCVFGPTVGVAGKKAVRQAEGR